MVNIQKSGDSAIKFTFTDNDRYLYDGEITVPLNSLILVFDESNMAVFKKIDGDVFLTFLIGNSNFSSKSDLETFYKDNMVGSTGGGGVTSGEVQTMIDESISGLAESSAVTEEISEAVSGKADSSAVTEEISAAVSGKADSSAVTASINAAVSGKMDTSAFNTYSASTDARISEDEEVTAAALVNLDERKADTSAVTASIAAAVSGKQDTLIAGSGITIDSANTISCTVEGGGKAIEAGRGIAITTGATADTVSFDLPISAGTGSNSLVMGEKAIASGAWSFSNGNGNAIKANTASGERSIAIGYCCEANSNTSIAIGQYCNVSNNAYYAKALGSYINVLNWYETSLGNCNISNKNNTNSGNTLFSIGNGQDLSHRHNAIEIRTNGDIYIADTNDTTYQNYYEKPMIKLQDALGGLPESAFTAYTAATDARLAEDEEVTAAALNTLNTATAANTTALGGFKLVSISQADYDLLPVKDPNTLYIITNVVN